MVARRDGGEAVAKMPEPSVAGPARHKRRVVDGERVAREAQMTPSCELVKIFFSLKIQNVRATWMMCSLAKIGSTMRCLAPFTNQCLDGRR